MSECKDSQKKSELQTHLAEISLSPRGISRRGLLGSLGVASAAFPFVGFQAFASPSIADEYDTLREKYKTLLTGGNDYAVSGGVATDADINARIRGAGGIDAIAQGYWDSLLKGASRDSNGCLWTDLANPNDWAHITVSYDRLKAMALAYSTRGSGLYNNTTLVGDIKSALDWLYANRYNEGVTNSSWYYIELGIPFSLNDTVVLIYSSLSTAQITNYMNAVNYFSPSPNVMTGANRVWKAQVVAIRGLIVKDGAKITAARDALSPTFDYVTSGDGFYTDGSFIQHGRHPYTGGYGAAMIGTLPTLIYLLSGSTWTLTDADRANIYQWVYEAFEPLMYKGAMADMSRGRDISRRIVQDHARGHSIIGGVIRISQYAPSTDASRMKSMVKAWITTDTYRRYFDYASVNQIVLSKAIVGNSSIVARGDLVRHKRYQLMDRVMHHRPGWTFGISMSSNRIYTFEAINNENKRGWYTADGMTYLYTADLAQYSEDFWPTVNAYRLPGTTVDTLVRGAGSGANYLSAKNWVGGISSSGQYGIAGMELDAWSSNLVAKKSWFMFDDEVVALGAGINNTGQTGNGWDGAPRRVETIVENRRLIDEGYNDFWVNGTQKSSTLGWSETMTGVSWAHLQGNGTGDAPDIGYYFPGGATIKGKREARTAAWNDINSNSNYPAPDPITRNYLNLWFDHGTNPTNKTYAYVLLPGKNRDAVSVYATAPEIQIWHNTTAVQAVKESTLNIVGANFWNDGGTTAYIGGDTSRPFITSNKKAAVMVNQMTPDEVEITVSDPTQANTGTIQIEVRLNATSVISLSSSQITVDQLGPTIKFTVNVNNAKGGGFTAKFRY